MPHGEVRREREQFAEVVLPVVQGQGLGHVGVDREASRGQGGPECQDRVLGPLPQQGDVHDTLGKPRLQVAPERAAGDGWTLALVPS
jgi:hypothetical protein